MAENLRRVHAAGIPVAMGTDAVTVEGWAADFDGLMDRVGTCFARRDRRGRAAGYVRGLLGRVDRKNGWQVAEYLGDDTPYGVQRLLGEHTLGRVDAGGVLARVGHHAQDANARQRGDVGRALDALIDHLKE